MIKVGRIKLTNTAVVPCSNAECNARHILEGQQTWLAPCLGHPQSRDLSAKRLVPAGFILAAGHPSILHLPKSQSAMYENAIARFP